MLKKMFDLDYFLEDFRKPASRLFVVVILALSFIFLGYVFAGKQAFLSKGGYGIPALLSGEAERKELGEEVRKLKHEFSRLRSSDAGGASEEYKALQKEIEEKSSRHKELTDDVRFEGIYSRNWSYIGWFFSGFFFLFLIPVAFIALHPRLKLRDFGLGLGDWRFAARVFGVFSGIMIIAVLIIALFKAEGFLNYYPMFARGGKGYEGFLLWFIIIEFFYFLYFVGWEFFFRSLLLFPFEKSLGRFSALVNVLPFAIMHIGKPTAEAFGSIIAGYFLALLVLRTRSFWVCVFIHFFVAFAMDLTAAVSRGLFA